MKHKKKIILGMVMVLMLVLFGGLGLPVHADTNTVDVYSLDEFITALNSDADIICVMNNFNVDRSITLGDANNPKTVTREGDAMILCQYSDTNIIMFQSITFDGCGNTAPIVDVNCETVFSDCTFKNCNDSSVKVWTSAYTTFEKCTFKDNTGNKGGHISFQGNGTYTLTDCTFTNGKANKTGYADNEGGAIYIGHPSSTVTMTGCKVTGNSSTGNGGGISNKGNLTVTGSLVYDNSCDGTGQDIHNEGTLTLSDSLDDLTTKMDSLSLVPEGWMNEDTQTLLTVPDTFTGALNVTLKTNPKEEPQEDPQTDPDPSESTGTPSGTTGNNSGGTSSSPSTQTVTQTTGTTTINVTVPDTNGTQGTTTTNLPQSSQTTTTPQTQGQTPQVVTVTTDKQKDDEGNVIVNNNITISVQDPEQVKTSNQVDDTQTPLSSGESEVKTGTVEKDSRDWTGMVTNVLLLGVIGYLIFDKIQLKRKKS